MSLETDLYDGLTGDATIGGLVSTRIYPNIGPDNPTYPLLVYRFIDELPLSSAAAGANGHEQSRVQISAFSTDPEEVWTLRDALRDYARARKNYHYVVGPDMYEDDGAVHHRPVDFIITHVPA